MTIVFKTLKNTIYCIKQILIFSCEQKKKMQIVTLHQHSDKKLKMFEHSFKVHIFEYQCKQFQVSLQLFKRYIIYFIFTQPCTRTQTSFSSESQYMGFFSISITNEILQMRKISLMPDTSDLILHYMTHFPSLRTVNKLNQLF